MTKVMGVIGGIGSGKSAVSEAFRRTGALVLDADALAHEVLERDETRDALKAAFGPNIFDEGNALDRQALARLVFGPENKEALKRLNAIVHPAVRLELERGLREAREQGVALIVLDIPLLMESPFLAECDYLVFVKASRDTRLQRVAQRHWSADELDRRESSQCSLAEKEEASDFILENESSLEELEDNVRKLFDQIVEG